MGYIKGFQNFRISFSKQTQNAYLCHMQSMVMIIEIEVSKLAIGLQKKFVSSDSLSAPTTPSILCRV